MQEQHIPVITIDGPSGTGKGTISLKLAQYLNWHYLDSGALYRVLAYAAEKHNIRFDDVPKLVKLARSLDLRFEIKESQTVVLLDGEDVSKDIRSESCGQNASKLASIQEVREALLNRQRNFAKPPGLVTDGRDMGTVVFPEADLKLYLYASAEERAYRRYKQLKDKGNNVSLAQVVEELQKRDERDTARSHSPLKPAENSVLIDTTRLNIVQVFNNVLQLALQRINNRS
ncbi:(d)CMP kinase [Legionella impletisoli]|uniref:Cytidylate kinase n=1 Tax=Legionella impletisoli TaxID=343510 RepID=A0A917JQN6_9GAMM|nr:(d)CMP kinase [Legionella impletisoli]GGI77849.1 cytidylate kinase [Legionella impletisoli]